MRRRQEDLARTRESEAVSIPTVTASTYPLAAMLRLSATVCIDAPAGTVWRALARLEDLVLWSEPVISARCEPGRSGGVGAERICQLKGGITLTERWSAWEEGHAFSYEGTGIPLVRRARNTWTVHPHGADRTLLESNAEVEVKGGPLGRLLEPLLAWQSRRLGQRSLAAFKHLVEHGTPPSAKHSRLPRIPATC
jgi:hypothetical protein